MSERIKQSFKKLRSTLKRYSRTLCISLMALAVSAVFAFLSFSVHTVSINCNGSNLCKFYTLKCNPANILASAGYDEGYSLSSVKTTGQNINIDICESFPVYVIFNGYSAKVDITEKEIRVLDVILKTGLDVDDNDYLSLPLDYEISEETYIDIVSIDGGEALTSSSLDKEEEQETLSVSYSQDTLVEQKKEEKQTATVSVSRADTSATVSTLTPSEPIVLDENGIPINYSSHITVQATAYTYTGHNCATGVAPQPGYIAVNPKIIPYGTKMYIRSSDGRYEYGYAIAADTGGFIRSHPTNVDLFFASNAQCNAFGRRNVEIYILE